MSEGRALAARYDSVRAQTERLCAPLAIEDHVVQSCDEVSPPKWHLGHTSWFFEQLLLGPHLAGWRPLHPAYAFIFNSYYESFGARVARPRRGTLSRPTVAEVREYRAAVDAGMHRLLDEADGRLRALAPLVELGLHHEQQHQELLVTDIKAILGLNPLRPAYGDAKPGALDLSAEHDGTCPPLDDWLDISGGTVEVGHGGRGFAYDNESPRHAVIVPAHQLRHALVTNAEYEAFVADGGYDKPSLWLSEGWDWVRAHGVRSPMYWQRDGSGRWQHYTLMGVQALEKTAPVTHVSYYEADAFCRWAGWRLPTEFEWEAGAAKLGWGRRWEWTQSAYLPYPGYRPGVGALGEYNGKFMVNQQVLRGSSFATAPGHARLSYSNFCHTPLRWQYTGIRPARDADKQA